MQCNAGQLSLSVAAQVADLSEKTQADPLCPASLSVLNIESRPLSLGSPLPLSSWTVVNMRCGVDVLQCLEICDASVVASTLLTSGRFKALGISVYGNPKTTHRQLYVSVLQRQGHISSNFLLPYCHSDRLSPRIDT